MTELPDKSRVARQVEMIIRQLNTLSTLPQVAAGVLPCILREPFHTSQLTAIVQADPALTASVMALAARLSIEGAESFRPLAEIIDRLPAAALREAVLSVNVFQAYEMPCDADSKRYLPRRDMMLHALATACAASMIAEIVLEPSQRHLAFTAGILHDIGKVALDEAMPKSFELLIEQARQKHQSLATIEQEKFGLTHALLGKRLAEKWHLPEAVISAIWLHHADPLILPDMPHGNLVMIVSLSDNLARQSGIGQSGSCDTPEQNDTLIRLLGLVPKQVEQILGELPSQVQEKCKPLGAIGAEHSDDYCEMLRQTAAQLARDNRSLSEKSRHSIDMELLSGPVQEFLDSLSEDTAADFVAGRFGLCLQKTFGTGPVAVMLKSSADEGPMEMAVVDCSGSIETPLIQIPVSVKPEFPTVFSATAAGESFGWCLDQISFSASRTLKVPLLLAGKPVAMVFFESPADIAEDSLRMICSIGASAIAGSEAFRVQRQQAERLVDLMDMLRTAGQDLAEGKTLTAIAETAAGAAHELNNPLAVISGRAQLLLQTEADPTKKQILEQIYLRTQDISDIITDLMAFARPREPYRHLASPAKLVAEALDKTAQQHHISKLEVQISGVDTLPDVFVDTAQVIASLGSILSNALESYASGNGLLVIEGVHLSQDNSVEIRITDRGCGMDEATLRQVTKPFFSAKPAGRKRGMGLAHTLRQLTLNGATLRLASQSGKGTTVTVTLPRA